MKSRRFAFVLIVAGLIAYAGSCRGPFLFDDHGAVVENNTIRSISTVWSPPREQPTAGRPLVNLSFALNYGMAELDVTGYHIVNLALHIVCALLLFGIVRRTLELPRLRGAFGVQSTVLGFVIALLWLLHPLNSEVVNYVSQRTESLMAVFYLATLYAAIRSAESKDSSWSAIAVIACAAGMACKESMVTAPVAVVLYDLAFRFSSLRDAFRRRIGFYVSLMSTWVVLGMLMWGGPRSETAGFSTSISVPTYLFNQAVMLTQYLRLAAWPRDLVLNYGRPVALSLPDVIPQAVFILLLLGLSVLAWFKRRAIGFAGLWVFLTLAPTTLVPIATEVGAERRMYLPLIGLIAVAVLGVFAGAQKLRRSAPAVGESRALAPIGVVAVVLVATAFGSAVFARTAEYQSPLVMARTVVARWPSNVAEAMAGVSAGELGLRDEAIGYLQDAVAHGNIDANYPLGVELLEAGQTQQAIGKLQVLVSGESHIGIALQIAARRALADAYFAQEDAQGASTEYQIYLTSRPNDAEALDRAGRALAILGKHTEAGAIFARLVALKPGELEPRLNLVTSLLLAADFGGAEQQARRALIIDPDHAPMLDLLGRALLAMNRPDDAVVQFEKAIRSDPTYGPAQQSLGAMRRRGSTF